MLLAMRVPAWLRAGSAGAALLLLGGAPAHGQAGDARKKKKAEPTAVFPAPAPAPTRVPDDEDFGPKTEAQLRESTTVVVAKPRREPFGRGKLLVGLRAGAALPEVVSNFGPSFIVGVEVGWVLPRVPLIGEGLALTVDFAYSQPEAGGNVAMAPVDGGNYKWGITQREASLGLTVLYRVPFLMQGRLVPYLGIGPRLFMLESVASAQPGANAVASFKETSSHAGMGLPLGADYQLGPGRVFLEVLFLYAPFTHNSTGATNAGALTIDAGYRMLFGLGG